MTPYICAGLSHSSPGRRIPNVKFQTGKFFRGIIDALGMLDHSPGSQWHVGLKAI
jgi:hypothetical protein